MNQLNINNQNPKPTTTTTTTTTTIATAETSTQTSSNTQLSNESDSPPLLSPLGKSKTKKVEKSKETTPSCNSAASPTPPTPPCNPVAYSYSSSIDLYCYESYGNRTPTPESQKIRYGHQEPVNYARDPQNPRIRGKVIFQDIMKRFNKPSPIENSAEKKSNDNDNNSIGGFDDLIDGLNFNEEIDYNFGDDELPRSSQNPIRSRLLDYEKGSQYGNEENSSSFSGYSSLCEKKSLGSNEEVYYSDPSIRSSSYDSEKDSQGSNEEVLYSDVSICSSSYDLEKDSQGSDEEGLYSDTSIGSCSSDKQNTPEELIKQLKNQKLVVNSRYIPRCAKRSTTNTKDNNNK